MSVIAVLVAVLAALAAPVSAAASTSGQLALAPGRSGAVTLGSSLTDVTASSSFSVPAWGSASPYFGIEARRGSDGSGYRAKVRLYADGAASLSITRFTSTSETVLSRAALPWKAGPGATFSVEISATGTNPVALKARAWPSGSTKPTWQSTYSDTSASRRTSAGQARVWGYLSTEATRSVSSSFAGTAAGSTPSGTTTTASSSSAQPTASNTGPVAGSTLTRRDGDITVTTPGTVLQNLDVHGFIVVKAPNVTIKNSIVRGGKATFARGVITSYGYDNLVIDHVLVDPQYPTVYQDGIKGSDFRVSYSHVTGNVDSVKVQGSNVSVDHSLLENTTYYTSDPAQNGGPTHNDGIQVLEGTNLSFVGNTIRGHRNFGILGSASFTNANVVVKDNWLDGGHCTIKMQEPSSYNPTATISGNKFGPNRAVSSCYMNATKGSSVSASGNTRQTDGATVGITWTDS